jgi:hypothetical protein
MMPEHLECPTIGGHSVVAADNPPQPFSLIRERISHCWLIASKNDRMSAYEAHLFAVHSDTKCIQRIVRAAQWPGCRPRCRSRPCASGLLYELMPNPSTFVNDPRRLPQPSASGGTLRRLPTCNF